MTGLQRDDMPLDRLASALTEALAPVVLAYGVFVAVAIGTSRSVWRGVLIGVVVATLVAGAPFGALVLVSRQGTLSGRHVPELRQRPLVLALAAASATLALVLLHILDGSRPVLALVLAALAGLLVAALISLWWKVSIHVAAAAGAVAALVIVFGPMALLLALVLAAVAWARVHLGAHSWMQVIGGAVVGSLITACVMSAVLM